jgi:hypothetical protein
MSPFLLSLALLLVLCAPVAIAVVRANQLFVLRVKAGRLVFLRGRMPQSLFDQLNDLVKHAPNGLLIAVRDNGRPRLVARGRFDAGLLQQIRNVIGLYPLAKLRAGGKPNSR